MNLYSILQATSNITVWLHPDHAASAQAWSTLTGWGLIGSSSGLLVRDCIFDQEVHTCVSDLETMTDLTRS